jgi:hypothetical protein
VTHIVTLLDEAEAILDGTGEGYLDDARVVEAALRLVIAHLRKTVPPK